MYDFETLPSTNQNFLIGRLKEQFRRQKQLIIAYDIDDTVRPFYCSDCTDVKDTIRKAKEILNAYFIVYTSNPDIEGVKDFLNEENLPYDKINENAEFVPFSDGKIYYNILLDDKAGLGEALTALKCLISYVQSRKEKAIQYKNI